MTVIFYMLLVFFSDQVEWSWGWFFISLLVTAVESQLLKSVEYVEVDKDEDLNEEDTDDD